MTDLIVVDTSVLIPLFNQGRFRDEYLHLNQTKSLCFSVVTVNELVRGAHSPESQEFVEDFLDTERFDLQTPTEDHWLECARLSEVILREGKRSREKVLLLQNDILIALGARDAGATLVTCDKKDFGLLKGHIRLPIEFW